MLDAGTAVVMVVSGGVHGRYQKAVLFVYTDSSALTSSCLH